LLWHWWPGFVWPTKGLWDEIRGKGRKNRRKSTDEEKTEERARRKDEGNENASQGTGS